MKQYLESLQMIKDLGIFKGDRTGTGTQSMFGQHERYDLRNNKLPVVTTKKIHLHSVIHELIWMTSGDTRVDYLIRNGVRIWNEWVKPETAVYEPLTYEETRAKVEKHIGDRWVLVFTDYLVDGEIQLKELEEYLSNLSEEALKAFWRGYPNVTDPENVKKAVLVNIRKWHDVRTPNGEGDFNQECMKRLHRLLFKSEPQRLIGGDLGAVYGKTWRNIEDVRIVPKLEWTAFEERGFKFVVDVPGTDAPSDRCVVERRIDQLQDVMDQLANGPDSRRIIVCAWDPRLVEDQALPPCHCFFQFWTRELSLEERVKLLGEMEVAEEKTLAAQGVVVRGKPPVESVEQFRSWIQVWSAEPVTDVVLNERLNLLGVPRRGLSCHLYQRSN